MSDAPAVEFRSVSKVFRTGKREHTVLNEIDLRIERGEILGVIGYSGAGKSTLARLINGLEKPTAGTIEVRSAPVAGGATQGRRTSTK
ncbi:ATP-binding cassette domain-containing protein, partial [Nocardia farcinica]|uniref:ATP-binding cassette domain-containing protein n=1 Tax=Nocardia farcinica TaxID=37329 RepID=UPI002456D4F7